MYQCVPCVACTPPAPYFYPALLRTPTLHSSPFTPIILSLLICFLLFLVNVPCGRCPTVYPFCIPHPPPSSILTFHSPQTSILPLHSLNLLYYHYIPSIFYTTTTFPQSSILPLHSVSLILRFYPSISPSKIRCPADYPLVA